MTTTRKRPTKASWVTQTGERIAVRKMGNEHLCNTIAFLRRRYLLRKEVEKASLASAGQWLHSDAALDAVESAQNELEAIELDDYIGEHVLCWETMLAEASRRGLDVPALTADEEEAASNAGCALFHNLVLGGTNDAS